MKAVASRRKDVDAIAALFRRALQPRRDPLDLERRKIEKLVSRAIERQEQRRVRQTLRALFERLDVELAKTGWTNGDAGMCAECTGWEPSYPLWSRRRPRYVACPQGHRLHIECLQLRAVDSALGFEAVCPRCGR